MGKVIENNQVTIIGKIDSEFQFSHKICGEGFYVVEVGVKRFSETVDRLPVMVSERLMDVHRNYTGECIEVHGQYRSFNLHRNNQHRLTLTIFAREVSFVEDEADGANTNTVLLDGFICKKPFYRKTPLGREITDVMLAVNRPYGKSDHIPLICWGRNARFASMLEIGDRIEVLGRIQSREYIKWLSDTESEKRTAYDVSVSKMEQIY